MVSARNANHDAQKSKELSFHDHDALYTLSRNSSNWSAFRGVVVIVASVMLSLALITILTVKVVSARKPTVDALGERTSDQGVFSHGIHSSPFVPPPRSHKAETARYIVHSIDWGSMSVISVLLDNKPFGVVVSFSDGPVENSTGVPYFYLSAFDPVVKSMKVNPAATLSLSEAQLDYCKTHSWDPEEPLCSRVSLTGKLIILPIGSAEEKFARHALFSRHPVMKSWPKDHDWQTLKLNITHIWLQDIYGPASSVAVKEYFSIKL